MMFAEEIRSIADEVVKKQREEKRDEAIKWANEYIEPRMKEAAEKGKYKLVVSFFAMPVDYHELRKFLRERGFRANYNVDCREITIFW